MENIERWQSVESTARYLMLARRDRRVEDEEGMVYLFAVVGHLCHCCLECCDSSNQAEWVELQQRMEDGRAGRDRKRGRFGRRKKNY